jgi:tRNA dimethylallyltransferase
MLPVPSPTQRPLVVLVGPTAVGKSAAAIQLAEILSAEIVSADSRCLYRGMDIGTAKPSPAERQRVPHHLIDVTSPDAAWSLTDFQAAAYRVIDDILARGRLPILAGGTGQYVLAVTQGWQVPSAGPAGPLRAELEQQLAEQGVAGLADRLKQVDPASALWVDVRNPRRVIRALEVALTTGESFVSLRRKQPPPYAMTWLGLSLPRPALFARIDARLDAMLAAGLVDEVRGLAAQGYDWALPAMSALGYKQIGQYLRGEYSLDEAVRLIRQATRRFVRRQANWFKAGDPAIHWFESSDRAPTEMASWLARGGAAWLGWG